MSSSVFFADIRSRDEHSSLVSKVRDLFTVANLPAGISKGDRTAVKLHFGELGNDSYINPVFVRAVVDKVREAGAMPFLTDTNTLYLGSRGNAVDHLETAIAHGFAYAVVGAPIIIADGLRGQNSVRISFSGRNIKNAMIAGDIAAADSLVVLSHFKGHEVAGFGGAIKNLGMGCATPAGKREQHAARPFSRMELCTGCCRCESACPAGAVRVTEAKASIDKASCIGCFECMTVCPSRAIEIDWETEIEPFLERIVEYACAVVDKKKKKAGFMNFLLRITPDCDCVPWSDTAIVPDIGILASDDPVALDAASFDLVNQQPGLPGSFLESGSRPGEDKFSGMRAWTRSDYQLRYAEEIGLGSRSYHLVTL